VVPDTPEKALAAALESVTGVGYLWTSESTGFGSANTIALESYSTLPITLKNVRTN
jgi:hypothetical protein